ncbi:MAG: hypothetical protein H7246_10510, partial [Phycisphaerae bacterium]|nr:hypothetical protein [Saprospiraceae bacterium]
QERTRKILLPDVMVSVVDSLGSIVDTIRTDLDGYYKTKILKKGNYKLCFAKDGFTTTCHSASVVWFSNHPGALKIDLKSNNYLFGTALLHDGRPGIYRNAVFGVEFFTTVEAKLGDARPRRVRANVSGEYLLTQVQRAVPWQVTAKCQKAVVTQTFSNNGGPLNLTLPNSSPVIRGFGAVNANNQAVMRTAPGQKLTVRVVVADPDKQLLTYVWVPMADAPGSTFGSTNQITWQLANLPGNYRVFMLVMDGFGGTAYQPFDIEAGDERVRFSGIIREIDGSGPIAGAQIKINGQLAGTSDVNGYFKFTFAQGSSNFRASFPEASQNRYVLNIEKVGYMLHSSILFNDATGKEYSLVKSTLATFDPKTEIDIQEREDQYTKFSNDKVRPPVKRPPARVVIPANAIVDSAGNKVTTPVLVGLRNVDLYDRRGLMPGDYGAIQDGKLKRLESFGAIDIQIRDGANPNRRYKLDSKAWAEVSIPIASPLVASAPATTTFWDYNETSGLWEDIGILTRVGDFYRGKTNKFSTLNADYPGADATCIQLLDNPNSAAVFPVNITVSVPNGGVTQVYTRTLNSAAADLPFAIVLLPPRLVPPAGVTIEATDSRIPIPQTQIQIVPTREPITGSNLYAPIPPYDYCNDVYLFLPQIGQLPSSPDQVFLNRIQNDEAAANEYYRLIGAKGPGPSYIPVINYANLNAWKASQGFSGSAPDAFNASYFNAGDLAFWRGMHQKNDAFYVSNFTRDFDSNDDVDGTNSTNAIATVAMESTPISATPGSKSVTKFLVFAGNGTLSTFADLDGYGPKYLPGLCIECHGGDNLTWSGFADGDALQSFYYTPGFEVSIPKFLPFDLQSFIYSQDPTFDRNAQDNIPNLTSLNNQVLRTNSYNIQEIRDFLLAAYPTSTSTTTAINLQGSFLDNAFPTLWNNTNPPYPGALPPKDFYTQVVGPSCRGCHITRTNQSLRFGKEADFNLNPSIGVGYQIFDQVFTFKRMPNAKVPFVNFWTSNGPPRQDELCRFLGYQPLFIDPFSPCK